MMNAAALEPVRWPPRRWFYAITLVFLGQVVLVFCLTEQRRHIEPPPPFRTTISLAVDPSSEQHLSRLPTLSDPTLFALPNLHGFSGGAWLTFPPLEHRFSDWTNSSHWLELDTASLGQTFLGFVNTNTTAPVLVATKSLPPLPIPPSHLTTGPLAARSELRVEGDLARRPLLHPLALPSWPYPDILTNTVVQLLVDADGDTLPATLLSSCGYDKADQFALKLAAGARFQSFQNNGEPSLPSSKLTWGKLIFQWHTVPRPSTNAVSVPP